MFTVKVKSSTEYDKFKLMRGNRQINQNHVNRLKESMKVTGDSILKMRPIIVNDEGYIVDGQNRFHAAKSLGLPVWYINSNRAGIQEVQVLNQNNRNWSSRDFAESYSTQGYQDYQIFLEFMRTYSLNFNEALKLLNNHCSNTTFKAGMFKIKNLESAHKHMSMIADFKPYYDGYKRRSFIFACLKVFQIKGYNHNIMKKKLKSAGPVLVDSPAVSQYVKQLEKIYNYKNVKNKLRFF